MGPLVTYGLDGEKLVWSFISGGGFLILSTIKDAIIAAMEKGAVLGVCPAVWGAWWGPHWPQMGNMRPLVTDDSWDCLDLLKSVHARARLLVSVYSVDPMTDLHRFEPQNYPLRKKDECVFWFQSNFDQWRRWTRRKHFIRPYLSHWALSESVDIR